VDDRDAAHRTCRTFPTDIYEWTPLIPRNVQPLEPVHQVLISPNSTSAPSASTFTSSHLTLARFNLREKGTYGDVRSITPANYGKLNPAEKIL